MIGFILAAGAGSRLRPLTDELPKPMVRLHDKPILEYNVRLLARYGVTTIIVNTWHRPEAIERYFGDGAAFGVHLEYSREATLLGTAGALLPAQARLTETFALLYGDNLTGCDLDALSALHRRSGAVLTMALFERDGVGASGVADLEGDRIVGFVEKPSDGRERGWVNAGVLLAEPEIFEFIPRDAPSDFGRDVVPALLRAGKPIAGYRMRREGLWWIDTPEDYRRTASDPGLARLAEELFGAPRG